MAKSRVSIERVSDTDFEFEEFLVPEPVGLSFHGCDFVVGTFECSCRDRLIVPIQDSEGVVAMGA